MDPELPRLWCKPAAAALTGPLAWELLSVAGVALKKKKKKRGTRAVASTYSLHPVRVPIRQALEQVMTETGL